MTPRGGVARCCAMSGREKLPQAIETLDLPFPQQSCGILLSPAAAFAAHLPVTFRAPKQTDTES